MDMLSAAAFSLTGMFRSAEITWPTALYLLGGAGETLLLMLGGMALGLLLGTIPGFWS